MSKPILFADFNNADVKGRLRLNCAGTTRDLAEQKLNLEPGLRVILYDGDELEADGEVQFSADENIWVAVIEWNQVRERDS